MNSPLSRRSFCLSTLLGTATLSSLTQLIPERASAIGPFQRSNSPRLRLSLAAYSFRDFFPGAKKKKAAPTAPAVPVDKTLDMMSFIDYCAEQGCEGAELTSYYFPPDATDGYFLDIRRHAHLRGVTLSGTAVSNNFTFPAGPRRDQEIASVKKWVDRASLMGMPHIRVFGGEKPKDITLEEARANCLSALEEVGAHAAQKGIFLGIENHGGIVADAESILKILQEVKNPWIGINLDTGNFHTEDPFADLERCAPYAVNIQYKAEMRAKGEPSKPADLARVIRILRKARYQGFFTLEYESAPSPWEAVPRILQQIRTELAKG